MLGATLCFSGAPAGADPPGSLQQQAAALSHEMLLEQLQIGGYLQQRAAYMEGVVADDVHMRRLESEFEVTQLHITADRARLRDAAVRAYVEGGTQADGVSGIFATAPSEDASTVYTQVMNADLTSAVIRLRSDLRVLRTEQAMEQETAAQARNELDSANTVLAAAESTQEDLASQRVSVNGQLAIAQEQAQAQQQQQAQEVVQEAATNASAPSSGPANGLSAASTGALPSLNSFLRCVVQAESDGDYQAISPTGQYMGAFQFAQPTWDEAAGLAGLPTLVGVAPYQASMRDQDLLAIALYDADGEQPWYDPCTE